MKGAGKSRFGPHWTQPYSRGPEDSQLGPRRSQCSVEDQQEGGGCPQAYHPVPVDRFIPLQGRCHRQGDNQGGSWGSVLLSNPCTLHRHTSQPGARYSLLLRFCSAYPGATLKETPNLLSICPSKAKLSVFSLSFPHGTGEEVPLHPSKQLWLSDHALRA